MNEVSVAYEYIIIININTSSPKMYEAKVGKMERSRTNYGTELIFIKLKTNALMSLVISLYKYYFIRPT
jgi:hypothetical protein